MRTFLLLSLIACISASTDLKRARTKVPGDHVRGSTHEDMVTKLNLALTSTPDLRTKPCEQFSVAGLIQLQKTIYAAREPQLQHIYKASKDNRRLGAAGRFTDDLEELQSLWKQEEELLKQHPELQGVTRDGKCHETVMWWIHHVTESTKQELKHAIVLPLLATGARHTTEQVQRATRAPAKVVSKVMGGYTQGLGCAACHASGQTANNKESKEWPEELSYNATAYGAFPFWDNTGPGCEWCNPALGSGQKIRVKYSAKLNSEILMHTSCGNMGWTGAKDAPNGTACNHLFGKSGAFIYTPTSALSPEADGKFCCRSYSAGDSSFPGAVPKDWMRSMYLYHNKSGGDTVEGFSGDYYSGTTKYYYATAAGLQFWYLETKDGVPVEQGEGCYQPGVSPRKACAYTLPIMLYHDYDPKSFIPESHSASEFDVPDVCKKTTTACSAPGDSGGSRQYSPVMSLHARMAGVGSA